LNEVISWKIERVIATPAKELRISRQRMNPAGGQDRYVVTVATMKSYRSTSLYLPGWDGTRADIAAPQWAKRSG